MRTNYNLTCVLIACLVVIIMTSFFIAFYKYDDTVVITDRQVPEKKTMFMMITVGRHNDKGWNEAQIEGFSAAVNQLDIDSEIHDNITPVECKLYIDDFVVRGGGVVIAPSDEYVDCINTAAAMYPKVKFVTTINEKLKSANNVYSFYGRMYYMRYLSGILAAMTSQSSSFGYVYVKRNSEVLRGINAFALGVKKIKPHARIITFKVGKKGEDALPVLLDSFYDKYPQIKTWTYHLSGNDVEKFCEKNFLKCVSYHVNKEYMFVNSSLVSAVWDWTLFYRRITRSILTNSFLSGEEWLSLSTATVKLKGVSSEVPVEVVNYVDSEMSCLVSNECNVFTGPIYDNQGKLRVPVGKLLSNDELLNHMDWFADGVEEANLQ